MTHYGLRCLAASVAAALCSAAGAAAPSDGAARVAGLAADLAPPVQVMAGDQPINVDIGHAAPFYADIDGDGINDLLVGQFGEGKLRIYKNTGSNEQPQFGEFTWFKAGGDFGKVPYG